ncbi:MAG: C10 family peptidase [Paludibacteraceae bacterium]|nr:C10 family peptidase [Paludibacteraceae bacterium]
MKKIFFGLAALMLSMTVLAERVSQEDAALVANNFMNVGNTVSGVQKAPAKKMVLKKAATASENQYYVYENANGEGWVMIAADDAITPILAYSPTGKFVTENMPINARNWMSKYDKFIKKVVADGVVASDEAKTQWNQLRKGVRKATAAAVVGPLVQTKWDQDEPYNLYAPGTGTAGKNSDKAYTGCVATAMAQVLNYWQWPVQGNGSHKYQPQMDIYDENTGKYKETIVIYEGELEAKFGETTYDWANMKTKHTTSDTQAQKEAIGTLMFHCGVSVDMQYGGYEYDGSGAYTIDWGSESDPCAQNAFWKYFRYKKDGLTSYYRDGESGYYDSWSDADWTAMVKAELDKQHPIMYDGSGDGGHSFICDGYDNSSTPKFHFNWGWSGDNDGYYALNNLVPGSGGAGGGGYNFNETQAVIIGIVPDKKDMPKVIVTWSVDGEETDVEFTQEDPLVLPDNPANCENGKVFVGWTAQSEVSGERPSDLFTKAGSKSVIEAITYYAVFANEEGGSAPVKTTLTMEDYKAASGIFGNFTFEAVKNSGSTAPTYNADGKDVRLYAKNTLTISSATEMTEIVFNISTAGLKRLAPITASTGTITTQKSGDTQVTWTGSATSVTFTVGDKADYGTDGSSKAGQLDFTSVDITTGGGATYSNYSITCSGVTPEPVYYNIRFFNNGTQIGETQNVLKNQQADVPTGITAECEDYTFVGWWTAELPADNQVAQTWVTNFKATKDQDYYAIFSKTEEGQGGAAEEKTTYTFTSKAWADATNSWTSNADGNQYNNDNQGVQVTTGTTGAGAETKNSLDNVSKVVFKYCTNATKGVGSITVTVGTAELSKDVTKTGGTELRDLEFAFDNKSGKVSFEVECTTNSIYVNSVTITAGGGTSSTTYYSSVVTCGETAIDNNVVAPKAIKVLENGQIVIILGDQKYTIFGQKIQ